MRSSLAAALVFTTSAAVLVLEILAARLLAPYVGLTLEAYTAIIGTILAGIAAGTWLGGRAADRFDPRRLLGPLLVVGGGLAMASVPLVRALGAAAGPDDVVLLAGGGLLAPAAVLSAISPTVVKLQLRSLDGAGEVVGRLSAIGTAGAIAGTFVAGFVLVELAPTSTTIVALGGALVVVGLAVGVGGRRRVPATLAVVALGLLGAGGAALAGDRCHRETAYHCVRVEADPDRPTGRVLLLDTLRHSYVDLADPTHLELRYARVVADVVDVAAPAGPLDVVHVGGGGFTMPRWLDATRPGGTNLVLEIDGGLVDVARDHLGLSAADAAEVRVGDARLLVAEVADGAADVVVGDAFGGLAVPWHLTTTEFVAQVRRVLRPGGTYVLNVIDRPPLRFARAELATLRRSFAHVAAVARPEVLGGEVGGNLVLAASDRPFDGAALGAALAGRGAAEVAFTGPDADALAAGAPVLRDDHAPVDQWIAR